MWRGPKFVQRLIKEKFFTNISNGIWTFVRTMPRIAVTWYNVFRTFPQTNFLLSRQNEVTNLFPTISIILLSLTFSGHDHIFKAIEVLGKVGPPKPDRGPRMVSSIGALVGT